MGFINLDLEELLNGGDFSPLVLKNEGTVQYKRVKLDPPQMGFFTEVTVTRLQDGTKWLDFLSDKYVPNKELMDFIAYCYERWGLDSQGRGVPSDDDVPRLKDGSFGRTWEYVKIAQIKRPENLMLSIALRIIIENEEMSNFINQLAKGFVRSAVNQVGRDGGRVISNSLYNGKNQASASNFGGATEFNQQGGVFPAHASSTSVPFTTGKMVWLIAICFFLNIVGSLGVLIYGLAKYFTTSEKMVWKESVPLYASDRRYKSGARYMGSSNVTKSVVVNASPHALEINKRNGKIAMIIGGVFLLFFAVLMIV